MNNTDATVEILKSALENNAIILNNFSYNDDESAKKANAFNQKQIEDFIINTYNALHKANESYEFLYAL